MSESNFCAVVEELFRKLVTGVKSFCADLLGVIFQPPLPVSRLIQEGGGGFEKVRANVKI
jgi:hypothetical protein